MSTQFNQLAKIILNNLQKEPFIYSADRI